MTNNTDTNDAEGEQLAHPLQRLKEQAEERMERAQKERVHCPECGTEVLKDTVEEAVETAETHDEKRHNGKRTSKVNGILIPSDKVARAAGKAVQKLRDGGDSVER